MSFGDIRISERADWLIERVATAGHADVAHVTRQLARLEQAGLLPIVPAGGPQAAASFERIGVVCARRLAARLHWTLPSGEELFGDANFHADQLARMRSY